VQLGPFGLQGIQHGELNLLPGGSSERSGGASGSGGGGTGGAVVLDGVASKLHEGILQGGALEAELIKRHPGGVGQLAHEVRGLVGNHQAGAAFLVGGLSKGDALRAQRGAESIEMVGAHQHRGLRVVLHKVIGGLVRH